MEKEVKDAMIASIDAKEAVEKFVENWYGLEDLYKTEANASILIMDLKNGVKLNEIDPKGLDDLLMQHNMMTKLIEGIIKGEELV